jgi:hypothetical protein
MSREFNELSRKITQLDKNVDGLEKKFGTINVHLKRIENKVNHIINFLEEFLVADSDEEDNFDSDETWVADPEAWKGEEDSENGEY